MITGRVHSLESMGTLDGPGVRFVVFMQGCPLRCGCCHNPDTWDFDGGKVFTPEEIVTRVRRCREYFGKDGGITISGGEPLMQAEFCREVFTLCKAEGINTCLDTSGCVLNDEVKALLCVTDRVLLDIKYTTDAAYRENVGMPLESALSFLSYLDEKGIPTTVRQVIIPTKNDTAESVLALKNITRVHTSVDKIELLPFKKICTTKYKNLGIPFSFESLPTPTKQQISALEALLNE